MKISFFNTLAAAVLTSFCVAGMADSASAQFFSDSEVTSPRFTPPNGRVPTSRYNDRYNRPAPPQWQDRSRMQGPLNRPYIRTNASDQILQQDKYRSYQGRCADGQCRFGRGERGIEDGTTFYRSRRSRSNDMVDGRSYQSGQATTTGWAPSNPDALDPISGLPMERSQLGRHNRAEGALHRGHGHGRCGDCTNGQRKDRNGQFGSRSLDPRNSPASYDNLNLTRRNQSPQYLPTRSPYLN